MNWSNIRSQNRLIILVLVVLFIAGGAVLSFELTIEHDKVYRTFSSEEYGFSFSLPADFKLENVEHSTGSELWFSEGPLGGSNFIIYIQVGDACGAIGNLENISGETENIPERIRKNMDFIEGPKRVSVDNTTGLGYTAEIPTTRWIKKHLFLVRGNRFYDVNFYVQENAYKAYQDRVRKIINSFTFY